MLPACGSQQIHDGRIQENYASQLIALTGIYEGAIELDTKDRKIVYPAIGKTQIELKIKINGEIQLSTKHDLLGEGCGSNWNVRKFPGGPFCAEMDVTLAREGALAIFRILLCLASAHYGYRELALINFAPGHCHYKK